MNPKIFIFLSIFVTILISFNVVSAGCPPAKYYWGGVERTPIHIDSVIYVPPNAQVVYPQCSDYIHTCGNTAGNTRYYDHKVTITGAAQTPTTETVVEEDINVVEEDIVNAINNHTYKESDLINKESLPILITDVPNLGDVGDSITILENKVHETVQNAVNRINAEIYKIATLQTETTARDKVTIEEQELQYFSWVQTTNSDFNSGTKLNVRVKNNNVLLDEESEDVYYSSGLFTSSVHDADYVVDWDKINWSATVPENTSITIQTKTGNVSTPDATWSEWSTEYTIPDTEIVSPNARYIQYRVNLTTNNTSITPILHDINITYINTTLVIYERYIGYEGIFRDLYDAGKITTRVYTTVTGVEEEAVEARDVTSYTFLTRGKYWIYGSREEIVIVGSDVFSTQTVSQPKQNMFDQIISVIQQFLKLLGL